MNLVTIREFRDLKTGVLRAEGERFEATKERAEEINSAGYGQLVKEAPRQRRTKE